MGKREVPADMKQLAHDVNGLMACAQLSVDSLAESTDDASRKRAIHLQRVIDNTVQYCRQAMVAPDKQATHSVSATEILKSVVDLLVPMAAEHGLKIKIQSTEIDLPADRTVMLHRILFNLGRNAINAMANCPGGTLLFKVSGQLGNLHCDVIDQGQGLDERALAHFTADADLPIIKEGRTRLGLRSTLALANRMGGKVEVLKTDERGTSIRVAIPLIPTLVLSKQG